MQTARAEGTDVLCRSALARAGDAGSHGRERLVLGLVLTGLVLLYAPTLRWLLDRWTMSVWHHAHGLVIPPIVAYFVWRELRQLRQVPPSASAWGFGILVPALGLHAVDAGIHTQLLSAVSLVLALPGLALLFLGWPKTRAILWPLAFAAFMLPIPLTVTEPLHLLLRQIAVAGSSGLIPVLGIPLYVEGTTLHVPNASLLVGDACSGFSTLYAALAIGVLMAYMGSNAWRRVLVVLAAPLLAIAANVMRVALLVVLVYWQGTDVLATALHPLTGVLTFVVVLPVIFWLGQDSRRPAP